MLARQESASETSIQKPKALDIKTSNGLQLLLQKNSHNSALLQKNFSSSTEKEFSAKIQVPSSGGLRMPKTGTLQNGHFSRLSMLSASKSIGKSSITPKVDIQKILSLFNSTKIKQKNQNENGFRHFLQNGKSNLLQPSMSSKLHENLQNIMRSRMFRNSNQSESSEGNTNLKLDEKSSSAFMKIIKKPQETSPLSLVSTPTDKMKQLNLSQLQLLLKDSSIQKNKTSDQECSVTKSPKDKKVLGKRKRKTERELKILRQELKRNVMWTRQSIKEMRKKYEQDFEMSEQQIYKWWWDQTRKRSKKGYAKSNQENQDPEEGLLVSFQDEFGGYSSRLRLQSFEEDATAEKEEEGEGALELNLCQLLGIDVEGIAYRLAVEDESDIQMNPTGAGSENDLKRRCNETREGVTSTQESQLH